MQTIICAECGKEKTIKKFNNKKMGKFGKSSRCRFCEKILREPKKEDATKRASEHYYKNREKILLDQKQYRKDNKKKIADYKKNYRDKNKKRLNKEKRNYVNEKRRSDFSYKIKANIQSLFRESFRKQNLKKNMAINDYTGFDIEYYSDCLKISKYSKEYLQKNKIQIDHIIPCNAYNFNDPEEIKKCWHPKNLRLLPITENKRKHNKVDMGLIKKYGIKHLLPK